MAVVSPIDSARHWPLAAKHLMNRCRLQRVFYGDCADSRHAERIVLRQYRPFEFQRTDP